MKFSAFIFALSLAFQSAYGQAPANKYPITVLGSDDKSFEKKPSLPATPYKGGKSYDVVVIGGGLAGLASATYLARNAARVLLLEKEKTLGGLAAKNTEEGMFSAHGAAYWTKANKENDRILEDIGLGDYDKNFAIHSPIDSYLKGNELFVDFWEHDAELAKMPASFALFKHVLNEISKADQIANQPMEDSGRLLKFDELSATDWIRKIPFDVQDLVSAPNSVVNDAIKMAFARYKKEQEVEKPTGMQDVIDFLDLYCRSALGSTCDKISALVFINFYSSELEVRYANEGGTHAVAEKLEHIVTKEQKKRIGTLLSAQVLEVENQKKNVSVTFTHDGKTYQTKAKYVVFAAPLHVAPRIIKNFREDASSKARILDRLEYAHYVITGVEVSGHPFRTTYDTWVYSGNNHEATDIINGRWMNPKYNGYKDFRDFTKDPTDPTSVYTLYHNLGEVGAKGLSVEGAKQIAKEDVLFLKQMLTPFSQKPKTSSETFEVKKAFVTRWPYSIHVAAPGFFKNDAPILRRPLGKIYFAHNNLGAPSVEEALFRGHCAANNILKKMRKFFKQEVWTKCYLDE